MPRERTHGETKLDFVEFRAKMDAFAAETDRRLNDQAVMIRSADFANTKDNRWIISAALAFVVPVLSIAYFAGQYPKREEIISIVVDRTTDVEHDSEKEIKRVESVLRADIRRIEAKISGLEKQLTAIRNGQRRKRRR